MRASWKPLLAAALVVVLVLLVWRFFPGRPPPEGNLTNATIDRLESEVDSLRLVVEQRDSAIRAYDARVASLDGRLAEISRGNDTLIANLNRQRRTIEHVSDDSLARDLNRILRSGLLAGRGAAVGVR